MKKAVETHRLFRELCLQQLAADSCADQNQQQQRQQDAARRALSFFDDNRCFNNRLCQVASGSSRSGASQGSGENEFFHVNLQNLRGIN